MEETHRRTKTFHMIQHHSCQCKSDATSSRTRHPGGVFLPAPSPPPGPSRALGWRFRVPWGAVPVGPVAGVRSPVRTSRMMGTVTGFRLGRRMPLTPAVGLGHALPPALRPVGDAMTAAGRVGPRARRRITPLPGVTPPPPGRGMREGRGRVGRIRRGRRRGLVGAGGFPLFGRRALVLGAQVRGLVGRIRGFLLTLARRGGRISVGLGGGGHPVVKINRRRGRRVLRRRHAVRMR
jgi:hypothetical protein